MIAEPIKAKQNLQFVSNLLYAIKKQEKEEKSDQIDKAKKIFPKLQPIENIKEITDELISELSSIPNQLEYLIDESFPYDSNTFIEELENGKIDMIYQILFFCMIHTLDASIIYESGSSKELREYQVMYSWNSEDSFHSNSPPRNTRKDIIFNYYIFVNQDGTTEVMTWNQNQSQISFQPLKSHSFQVQQIHQAHNVAVCFTIGLYLLINPKEKLS